MQQVESFDVCIIGSGPAGAFAAKVLANSGKKVVVMECGDVEVDTNTSDVLDLEASPYASKNDISFSQQIGGTSNLWSGGLIKLDEIDLITRKQFGFEGWPFSWQELNCYYSKVDEYTKLQSTKTPPGAMENSVISAKDCNVLRTPFVTSVLVEESENLTLLSKTVATILNFNESTNKIMSVEGYDKRSNEYKTIIAKKFILAAGTLPIIQILLNTFERSLQNRPQFYDNLGRYFSTHPKGDVGVLHLFKPLSSSHPMIALDQSADITHTFQMGFIKAFLVESNVLNHSLRFVSSFHHRVGKLFGVLQRFISSIPFFQNGKLASLVMKLGIQLFQVIDKIRFLSPNTNKLLVRGFFDQKSRASNRIILSDRTNSLGLNLVKIEYDFNESDWKDVETFVTLFSRELEKLKLGKIEYKRPDERNFSVMHSHFIGGTRMGLSAQDSVVDQNLKVHGVDNLYISGPSTFPSFGYANPFYTIAAMSIRLAEELLNKDEW